MQIQICIMKAGAIQQWGKENERLYCRSNKRKAVKTPLKIREKIKELEVQAQQKERRTISKDKPHKANQQNTSTRMIALMPQTTPRTSFQNMDQDRLRYRSASRTSNQILKEPCLMKTDNRVLRTSKSPRSRQPFPQEAKRMIPHKVSSRTLASQNGQLTQLKEENQRYKRIYSHSLEKMQELEAKLNAIRAEHEAEKWQLEGTMHGLKQRIETKKLNLGHLYTHTQQDFFVFQDCIITETDNESSSILENLSKRFQPSSLSIDSK